jgi:hypothetical protein
MKFKINLIAQFDDIIEADNKEEAIEKAFELCSKENVFECKIIEEAEK